MLCHRAAAAHYRPLVVRSLWPHVAVLVQLDRGALLHQLPGGGLPSVSSDCACRSRAMPACSAGRSWEMRGLCARSK